MSTQIVSAGALVLGIAGFALPVVAAVLARRAQNRHGWVEARFAFFAFVAMPILVVLSIGVSASAPNLSNDSAIWVVFEIADWIITIAISVAIYRLARRGAKNT